MKNVDKDIIINHLLRSSERSKEKFSGELNTKYKNSLTIDNFFDILYDLFKSKDLIVDDYKIIKESDENKFVFTEEYPEVLNTAGNIITFELTKRAPASLSAGAEPFSGVKNYKPMYLGQEEDKLSNDIKMYFSHQYDNEITLICWSTHAKTARTMATMLENILATYYPFIRTMVPVLLLIGRSEPIFTNQIEGKRHRGIPVKIFVRTNEIEVVKTDELEKMPEIFLLGISEGSQITKPI